MFSFQSGLKSMIEIKTMMKQFFIIQNMIGSMMKVEPLIIITVIYSV